MSFDSQKRFSFHTGAAAPFGKQEPSPFSSSAATPGGFSSVGRMSQNDTQKGFLTTNTSTNFGVEGISSAPTLSASIPHKPQDTVSFNTKFVDLPENVKVFLASLENTVKEANHKLSSLSYSELSGDTSRGFLDSEIDLLNQKLERYNSEVLKLQKEYEFIKKNEDKSAEYLEVVYLCQERFKNIALRNGIRAFDGTMAEYYRTLLEKYEMKYDRISRKSSEIEEFISLVGSAGEDTTDSAKILSSILSILIKSAGRLSSTHDSVTKLNLGFLSCESLSRSEFPPR